MAAPLKISQQKPPDLVVVVAVAERRGMQTGRAVLVPLAAMVALAKTLPIAGHLVAAGAWAALDNLFLRHTERAATVALASSGWTATTTRQAAVVTPIERTHRFLALLAALADLALAATVARPEREAKAPTIQAPVAVAAEKITSLGVALMRNTNPEK